MRNLEHRSRRNNILASLLTFMLIPQISFSQDILTKLNDYLKQYNGKLEEYFRKNLSEEGTAETSWGLLGTFRREYNKYEEVLRETYYNPEGDIKEDTFHFWEGGKRIAYVYDKNNNGKIDDGDEIVNLNPVHLYKVKNNRLEER